MPLAVPLPRAEVHRQASAEFLVAVGVPGDRVTVAVPPDTIGDGDTVIVDFDRLTGPGTTVTVGSSR